MSRGAPDYASVFAEVIGAQRYTDYTLYASALVAAGMQHITNLGTVLTGYEIYQAVGVVSANGCDTIHALALYVNGVLKRYTYFEVEQSIFYPRHYIARAGDVMTATFVNFDAVARYFTWHAIGTYLTISSPPLKPSLTFGKKPKLKADEVLWQVEDTMFGKRWVKGRQQKIAESDLEIANLLTPEIKENQAVKDNGS